ncbi:hypothetical protein DVH26_05420 [Paenibacillus sp. H1-7]|uniref:polyprenyl synthetase family protein n=1 Tax=Paenibacillus sp. H1-7 TaxID=2282849 RepID=UPI001EF7FCA6|nr:polyprenyl synthetase family protein [Paenibacillus sp. H1-7]ULL13935.1 hypothetical protein DVH26_05420 [Paenibacillus sp. H1-7]
MKPTVKDEMNGIIDRYIHVQELNELMKSFVAVRAESGTKWGGLVETSHRMLGGNCPQIERAAALAELIMLTLDIVDDLQDRDKLHKAWMTCPEPFTLNAVLGFQAAFAAEIGLLQQELGQGSRLSIIEVNRLIALAVNGQQCDLSSDVRIQDEADYFAMVQHKSGSLIRLACYLGYSLAGDAAEQAAEQLNELASCLGVVAQIENDVNNLIQFDNQNDILQKKRTLPILHLLSYSEREFAPLMQFYGGTIGEEQFLQHKAGCLAFIRDSGCIEYAKVVQSFYYDRLEQLYESIPGVAPWKERFKETAFASFGIVQTV